MDPRLLLFDFFAAQEHGEARRHQEGGNGLLRMMQKPCRELLQEQSR